jgi:flagellar motor protein MotB
MKSDVGQRSASWPGESYRNATTPSRCTTALVQRSRRGWAFAIGLLPVVVTVTVGACGQQPCHRNVTLVVTGSSNEARAELPDEARTVLEETSLCNGSALLLAVDGDGTVRKTTVDITPRRGKEEERVTEQRRKRAKENVEKVAVAVRDVQATQPGHALLAGLSEAGRQPGDMIVAISSGIDVNNPLDLSVSGIDVSPSRVVAHLRAVNADPRLQGKTVLLAYQPVTGSQEPLTEPTRRDRDTLWSTIVKESGGDPKPIPAAGFAPPRATVPVKPVPIPEISSVGPDHWVLPGILFEPDRAVLLDPERTGRFLDGVIMRVRAQNLAVKLIGHTALDADGPNAGFELSLARAKLIANEFEARGIPRIPPESIEGVGPSRPLFQPPQDPRNRAVEIILTPQ